MTGEKITQQGGILQVPDQPIIPFIEGDGIGVDITPVMRKVVDAAVEKAYQRRKKYIGWKFMQAKRPRKYMASIIGCQKKLCRR